jgi:hypothetical protein
VCCYPVVNRDRPIGSCRYFCLRRDQGGDRGGQTAFPGFTGLRL